MFSRRQFLAHALGGLALAQTRSLGQAVTDEFQLLVIISTMNLKSEFSKGKLTLDISGRTPTDHEFTPRITRSGFGGAVSGPFAGPGKVTLSAKRAFALPGQPTVTPVSFPFNIKTTNTSVQDFAVHTSDIRDAWRGKITIKTGVQDSARGPMCFLNITLEAYPPRFP